MIVIHTQIHGYLRGHQLLSSSAEIPKVDQSVIDRLSDVAGPLRPSEKFEPYLSGYPLPSGERYVLARTWQDLAATRAGCVRTLSLIISAEAWATAKSLAPFLDLLNPLAIPDPGSARSREIERPSTVRPMAPVPGFRGGEFLEALFLEESKPVAVFGAAEPELIAVRLLTAVWADFRREFAFSTFARAPRRIEGRQFDLVFAPKDARSKFSDWPGRRIDGGADSQARHRWTGNIVERVFLAPVPRLLSDHEVTLAGPNDGKTAALLRISLLWDELVGKIDTSPTAALGLIDIAASRDVWNSETLEALQGAISIAVRSAVSGMAPEQAWEFLTALVRKMRGAGVLNPGPVLLDAATRLSAALPRGAVRFLTHRPEEEARTDLVKAVGFGIGNAPDDTMVSALLEAGPEVFGQILISSDRVAERTAESEALRDHLGNSLSELEPNLFVAVRSRLLPLLLDEIQVPLAAELIASLDLDDLLIEVRHLDEAGSLVIPGFVLPIVDRARELNGVSSLRLILLGLPQSVGRDWALFETLSSSVADLTWLLDNQTDLNHVVGEWLASILRSASALEFSSIAGDASLRSRILSALPDNTIDIRRRMLDDPSLPIEDHVALFFAILPFVDDWEASERAGNALHRCLRFHFGQDENASIIRLLDIAGDTLIGRWVVRYGVERGVGPSVASRNLIAFNMAASKPRNQILAAVNELAHTVVERSFFDIDGLAIHALANLLSDAMGCWSTDALTASARMLPLLLRSLGQPVSPLIAVAFPLVYREYAKADEVPELLKFIPFFDWDKCKSARQALVSAFLASATWAPGDLALTAWICGDLGKILRRVAKSYGGERYLSKVSGDLNRVPDDCRWAAEHLIADIRANWSSKYDWRD